MVSGNLTPLITWYRDNTTVQADPNNSNFTITSASRNHTGTYRCEAVVTAPGLNTYKTSYTVGVIVRCKSSLFIQLVFLVSFNGPFSSISLAKSSNFINSNFLK